MKKLLVKIALLTCLLGLTGCGKSDDGMSDTDRQLYYSMATICYMNVVNVPEEQADILRDLHDFEWDIVTESMESEYVYTTGKVLLGGLESWWAAQEELGEVDLTADIEAYTYLGMIDLSDVKIVEETKTTTVQIPLDGSKRDGVFEVTFDEEMNVTGITTNVNYTFSEKMTKAALNTLLGMGTVFCVLIFICLVISSFGLIPKVQKMFAKKKEVVAESKDAVDNAVAQIAEREEEELSDDLELVAVIAAAIAASEGAASTDGFVVRSIKRRR